MAIPRNVTCPWQRLNLERLRLDVKSDSPSIMMSRKLRQWCQLERELQSADEHSRARSDRVATIGRANG
jgi:hypothetical protein